MLLAGLPRIEASRRVILRGNRLATELTAGPAFAATLNTLMREMGDLTSPLPSINLNLKDQKQTNLAICTCCVDSRTNALIEQGRIDNWRAWWFPSAGAVFGTRFPPVWLTISFSSAHTWQSQRQHAAATLSNVWISSSLPFFQLSSRQHRHQTHSISLHTTLQAVAFSLLISSPPLCWNTLLHFYLNIDSLHLAHLLGAASSSRCGLPSSSWHSA